MFRAIRHNSRIPERSRNMLGINVPQPVNNDDLALSRQAEDQITNLQVRCSISTLLETYKIIETVNEFSPPTPYFCLLLLPPIDLCNIELPEPLSKLHRVQKLFRDYDSEDEKQTEELINWILANPSMGLRELEINLYINPRKVRHYKNLYAKLPLHYRLLINSKISFTPEFSQYLYTSKLLSNYDSKQIKQDSSTTASDISDLIFPSQNANSTELQFKYIEIAIDDNLAELIKIISAIQNFNFDLVYAYRSHYITLLDLFALFGSVECFKYMLLNRSSINNTERFAIAGGNLQIFRLITQRKQIDPENFYISLYYRRNDLYDWFHSNFVSDKSENISIVFSLTQLMDIQAIYAISQRNDCFPLNDLINSLYEDGNYEILRHITKFGITSLNNVISFSDKEIVFNFMNHMNQDNFQKLFMFSVTKGYKEFAEIMIHHEKFDTIKISDIKEQLKTYAPEILDMITDKLNKITDIKVIYQKYLNGYDIPTNFIYELLDYTIDVHDFVSFNRIAQVFAIALTMEQLKKLFDKSCCVFPYLYRQFIRLDKNGDEKLFLLRHFYNHMDTHSCTEFYDYFMKGNIPDLDVIDCISLCQSKNLKIENGFTRYLEERNLIPSKERELTIAEIMHQKNKQNTNDNSEAAKDINETESKLYGYWRDSPDNTSRWRISSAVRPLPTNPFYTQNHALFNYKYGFPTIPTKSPNSSNKPVQNQTSQNDPNKPVQNQTSQNDPNKHVQNQTSQNDPNKHVQNENSQNFPNKPVQNQDSQNDPNKPVQNENSQNFPNKPVQNQGFQNNSFKPFARTSFPSSFSEVQYNFSQWQNRSKSPIEIELDRIQANKKKEKIMNSSAVPWGYSDESKSMLQKLNLNPNQVKPPPPSHTLLHSPTTQI